MADPRYTEVVRLADVQDLLDQAQVPGQGLHPIIHALRGAVEYLPRLALNNEGIDPHFRHQWQAAGRNAHLITLALAARAQAELDHIRFQQALLEPVHTLPIAPPEGESDG